MVVLGYYLNDGIAGSVLEATKAKVEFLEQARQGDHNIITLGSGDRESPTLALALGSTPVEGINKTTRAELIASGVGALLLIVLVLYLLLEVGLLRGIKPSWKISAKGLIHWTRGTIFTPIKRGFWLKEVTTLSHAFFQYGEGLKSFEKRVELKTRTESVGEYAWQMTHDLMSLVKTLEMRLDLDMVDAYPEEDKRAIRQVIIRMRGLAPGIQEKLDARREKALPIAAGKAMSVVLGQTKAVEMLWTLADAIVAEKTAQYADRERVSFEVSLTKDAHTHFADVELNGMKRVLSNLIDNSVEAIGDCGKVVVSVLSIESNVVVRISDTGRGIPDDIIPKLFVRGNSFGKANGSGLDFGTPDRSCVGW